MSSPTDPDVDRETLVNAFETLENTVDGTFILLCAFLVFVIQYGFAVLTGGIVRGRHRTIVVFKTVIDGCVVALAFYLFGYNFGFGDSSFKGLVGYASTVVADKNYANFLFQYMVAATTTNIVSGAVTERATLPAYFIYAFVLTAWVYPLTAHWISSDDGILKNLLGVGVIDFAGCATVHIVGGVAALAGAFIVGPREGRFNHNGVPQPIQGQNFTLCAQATFLLWFGWYGFNCGSAGGVSKGKLDLASRSAVTMTLAAASAATATLVILLGLDYNRRRLQTAQNQLPSNAPPRDLEVDYFKVLNGAIAGLVSITGCCAFVDNHWAVVIGIVGATIYLSTAQLLLSRTIDDAIESFPVHGAAGLWGMISTSIFSRDTFLAQAGYENAKSLLFGGSPRLLAVNLIGSIIVAIWTLFWMSLLFYALNHFNIFRMNINQIRVNFGNAYPNSNPVTSN